MTSETVSGALRALALYYRACNRWQSRDGMRKLVQERRAQFYSEVWTQAGAARECPLRKVGGAFDFDCGGVHLRVRNNLTSLDDPITLQMAGDKALVHGLLRDSAVPVPAHVVCRAGDVAAARRFMTTVGRPCVVKPARRTAAGAGVTTGISGLLQLVRAMAHAGAHCDEVIVEQEVEGENLRLLYFDGELLDAVRRCSPIVTGDGATTIKRLVDAENVDRLQGGIRASQTLLKIDWELRDTLRRQGYRLKSVPLKGRVIKLKSVVNDNRGSDNEAVESLSADVVAAGARAAAAVGVRLSGVDVITPDPSLPLEEVGGVVIEVNTTPGYYYHYYKRGGPTPVATMILERFMAAGS